jgi:hypothetical protein
LYLPTVSESLKPIVSLYRHEKKYFCKAVFISASKISFYVKPIVSLWSIFSPKNLYIGVTLSDTFKNIFYPPQIIQHTNVTEKKGKKCMYRNGNTMGKGKQL